ncbi:MAG: sigma-70 family RNA polymerase sigma factor [Verrucomicrobia bacterium]|nr:sigma-70 family RNA polymerase sigma factor [Verrucomicrobiota bacterium]
MLEAKLIIDDSDNALLQRVAMGDHAAFAQFYDRVSGPLYSLALRMLSDEQDAKDALQEGMEELWRKAPNFDPTRSAAFTWSVMIFRSRLLDRLRSRSSKSRLLEKVTAQTDPISMDDHTSLQSLTRSEDCSLVRRVLSALREEQQELLRHAFFSGWTQQEIADNTGRPLGTVKTTIRRALIELRERLNQEGYEA